MKDTVTITRHDMAHICSDVLNYMMPDVQKPSFEFSKFLFFAGLIMAIMFDEDKEDAE